MLNRAPASVSSKSMAGEEVVRLAWKNWNDRDELRPAYTHLQSRAVHIHHRCSSSLETRAGKEQRTLCGVFRDSVRSASPMRMKSGKLLTERSPRPDKWRVFGTAAPDAPQSSDGSILEDECSLPFLLHV